MDVKKRGMNGNTSSATYFRTAVNGVCSGTLNLWTSSRVNMVEKKGKERDDFEEGKKENTLCKGAWGPRSK